MQQTRTKSSTALSSLFDAFQKTALAFGDRQALVGQGGKGRVWTYAEVRDTARRLAVGLTRERFASRQEIGIIGENCPEWPIAYLAIVGAGKTVVPIDANLTEEEIKRIVSASGITACFATSKFESMVPGPIALGDSSSHSWTKVMSDGDGPLPEVEPDQPAALIYTSGTTGAPKAVILTHRNLLSNLQSIRSALKFDHNDTFLSILPLHHTFEATCGFLTPLTTGSTVVYARSLKSKDILDDIGANGVTVMCGVPLLYEKMFQSIQRGISAAPLARQVMFRVLYALSGLGWMLGRKWGRSLFAPLRRKAGLSNIRMFVSGGAALPPQISRFFNLIGFDFLQGYGLTETSPVLSVNRPDDIEFGSVGPLLDGVDIRIDNPDASGIGEIVVRGDNITPGYKGNPEKTAEVLRDGWFYTGDLGQLRKGHLWITGRAKNLIVSAAGKNIYPEELEEKLIESRYVLEALVYGRKKKDKQGEEIRAILVPDIEQFASETGLSTSDPDLDRVRVVLDTVVQQVNQRIAGYKRISGFDLQLEELEKTSTKKIKRFLYK